jgi:hypothetical protein
MKKNNLNTKKFGIARTIIFPYKGGFRAVCLDFDIIEDCKTREKAEKEIKEAMIGYIKNVCHNHLDDALLNRHADKRYWKMYEEYLKLMKTKAKVNAAKTKTIRGASLYSLPINENCLV